VLLELIEQVRERTTAVEILESLLRCNVQGTQRAEALEVRAPLGEISTQEPIMQTLIDQYIEQGRREAEAAVLLPLIEDELGPPSEATRQRITRADADTLLRLSKRILTANSTDAVLH